MSLECIMILGDCLEVMKTLKPSPYALAYCDLPFGVCGLKWDLRIDLNRFWLALSSCTSQKSAKVFTATQPFASFLISSLGKYFRHELIWEKNKPTGFFNAHRAPLRAHEAVLVFGNSSVYNPQYIPGKPYTTTTKLSSGEFYGKRKTYDLQQKARGSNRFPRSVLRFCEKDIRTSGLNGKTTRRLHPTQKPVALLDWLIRTYSNPGDYVLDPTSGSGTTAVAALIAERNVTCVEKDPDYFAAGVERVKKICCDNKIDVAIEVRK